MIIVIKPWILLIVVMCFSVTPLSGYISQHLLNFGSDITHIFIPVTSMSILSDFTDKYFDGRIIDRLMLQMGIFKPKACYCLFNLCLVYQNLTESGASE